MVLVTGCVNCFLGFAHFGIAGQKLENSEVNLILRFVLFDFPGVQQISCARFGDHDQYGDVATSR
jgi:hypothetical protein